jgi:hypothetical protein
VGFAGVCLPLTWPGSSATVTVHPRLMHDDLITRDSNSLSLLFGPHTGFCELHKLLILSVVDVAQEHKTTQRDCPAPLRSIRTEQKRAYASSPFYLLRVPLFHIHSNRVSHPTQPVETLFGAKRAYCEVSNLFKDTSVYASANMLCSKSRIGALFVYVYRS